MAKQSFITIIFVIITSILVLINQAQAQTIWAVSNTEKISSTESVQNSNYVWSSAEKKISIKAATNEHEPFQLVITAGGSTLKNINVIVSDLISDEGTIATQNITLYREVFINVTRKSQYSTHPVLGVTGTIPDALVPFKDPYGSAATPGAPFNITSGKNQPIWIDVYAPPQTPAGDYTGTITVKKGASTIDTITLVVKVWDFQIPVERHIKTTYEFVEDIEWLYKELYGLKNVSDEFMENHYQALADRRLGAGVVHKRPGYDDATGFDWIDAESLYDRLINVHHFTALNLPSIYYEAGDKEQYAIKNKSGSPYKTANFTEGSDFRTKAIKYYQRLYHDFSTRGWIGSHYAMLDDESGNVSDEPYNIGEQGYKRVKQWSDILHNANPNIIFLMAGESIIPSADYDDVRGYVDIWDMYMDEVQLNFYAYQDHLAANPDEELWLVPNAYADFIDYPAVYHRTIGWFAYKYRASGFELWSLYAWYDINEEYSDPWKMTSSPETPFGLGSGALFYPGYNIENRGINIQGPVMSIRMELNRETMEDYEYLYLLEQQIGSSYGKGLADKIIPSDLYYGISTQPDDFYTAREIIGNILSQDLTVQPATISGTVKDSNSLPISDALVSTDGAADITDFNGAYSVTVMAGTYQVRASAERYLSDTRVVTAEPDETITDIDFTLTPLPQESLLLFNSFENKGDIWKDAEGAVVKRSSAYASDGTYSMNATFDKNYEDAYVGTEFNSPQNWTDYTSLEFDVYNDSQYRSLMSLEIYDSKWGTVFSRDEITLSPDLWARVKISIDGSFNKVLAMELYIDNYKRGDRNVYIDNFRAVRITEMTAPEIDVQAGAPLISIVHGDKVPSTADDTDFGDVEVSEGITENTFTIYNTGTADLTLDSAAPVTITGDHAADFTVTLQPVSPVAPGNTTTFTVRFDPSLAGLRSAAINIANNDSDENPYEFVIQGTGTEPDISVEPDSNDYGDVFAGSSASQTFWVKNEGTADLVVTSVTIAGDDTADFSVIDSVSAFTLTPGDSHDADVSFKPDTVGVKSTTLRFVSNDPDENPFDVFLTGNGIIEDIQAPYLVYFYPAAGAVAVPKNTDIRFRVNDDGYGVDLTTLNVTVNDSVIISDGADQTGGQVTITSHSPSYTVCHAPALDFTEGCSVSVRIQCHDLVSLSNTLDTSHTFSVGVSRVTETKIDTVDLGEGIVKDDSTGIEIIIPAGALDDTAVITIGLADKPPILPDLLNEISPVYHFGPDGLWFADSVIVRVPYTQEDLNNADVSDSMNLPVYYFSTIKGKWERLKVISADGKYISVKIKEFCYLVFVEIDPPVNVEKIPDTGLPTEFALMQNYPNPFNPETTVQYQIPRHAHVILRIYNMIGQEIRRLVDEEKNAGHHEIAWDGKDWSGTPVHSGIYLIRIDMGNVLQTKKCILLK